MSPAPALPALPGKTRAPNRARPWLLRIRGEGWLALRCGNRGLWSWRAKMLSSHYQLSRPTWRTAERGALKYKLSFSELLDWHVHCEIDRGVRETLSRRARPVHIVVDVGVNIGETTLNLARVPIDPADPPDGHFDIIARRR